MLVFVLQIDTRQEKQQQQQQQQQQLVSKVEISALQRKSRY
jgi:hypothetical protein